MASPPILAPLPRDDLAKRFYHLAFDLGVTPRKFIRELSNVGLSVGNQMVIVPDELETRIREVYGTLHPEPGSEPVAVADPGTPASRYR